jgi:hypothetical protein
MADSFSLEQKRSVFLDRYTVFWGGENFFFFFCFTSKTSHNFSSPDAAADYDYDYVCVYVTANSALCEGTWSFHYLVSFCVLSSSIKLRHSVTIS